MANMQDIKRRINSSKSIRKITKAMEMVAASNLRRAQAQAESSRPYAEKLKEVVASVAASAQDLEHPLLVSRPVKKTAYLVMTSDRGLAGGFNANLLRFLTRNIQERHQSKDEYGIFIVGRKGRDFLKRRDYPLVDEVTGVPDSPEFSDIKPIANKAVEQFAQGIFDELILVYNEFINPMTQRPMEKRLLPLGDLQEGDQGVSSTPYEYEPSAEGILSVLLPRYAETLVYSALLESKASEFGARMTAMGNANDNATDMIDSLTLQFNRARQAAITQELSEIVAGANALS